MLILRVLLESTYLKLLKSRCWCVVIADAIQPPTYSWNCRDYSSIRRSLERGHAEDCKATKAPQTRQLETDQGRRVRQGWAPPYPIGMRHHLWCMLTCVRFIWLFSWPEKTCVVCSYHTSQEGFCWPSAALSRCP